MPATTDADVARMSHIADATLTDTFHWPTTAEDRLYRDCPTAFWLAPHDDALPPTDGPAPVAPPVLPDADGRPLPATAEGLGSAMGLGVGIAGPVFVAAMSLVSEGFGTPLARIATGLGVAIVSVPLTVPFGGLAAALPVILGVSLLAWLGTGHQVARRRSLWAATGGAMGLVIAALFDAGMTTIPLVLTSIACATVAHRGIDWVDPEFA